MRARTFLAGAAISAAALAFTAPAAHADSWEPTKSGSAATSSAPAGTEAGAEAGSAAKETKDWSKGDSKEWDGSSWKGHKKPHGGVHTGGGGMASAGGMAAGGVLLAGGLGAGVYTLRRRSAGAMAV